MISVEDLRVTYGRHLALEGLSLHVEWGAVYALLGRNGAGKSSLIKILLGQRRADSGTAAVLGLDPWRDRPALMTLVGATPETPDAPPAMKVTTLEASVAPNYKHWDRDAFYDRLERFSIDRKSRFGDLSRGQKSLVMLSLALAQEPELLILDDPTLGLDPIARRFFFEDLVLELADRGTSVLLATHDLDGVERVASRVGVLVDGRLVADGPIDVIRGGLPLEEAFVSLSGNGRSRN